MIATSGVFSTERNLAPLTDICYLADRYDALVVVADSHSTGFLGPNGQGTPEEVGVFDRIDILMNTLRKALDGASGGFTTGRKELIDDLRQSSKPYLFSNTPAPPVVLASIKALERVRQRPDLRKPLWESTTYFRNEMAPLGFNIIDGNHPIVPIMLRDELKTVEMVRTINDLVNYVVAFSFPVVGRGQARIRVQLSDAHSREQLDRALSAFERAWQMVGGDLRILVLASDKRLTAFSECLYEMGG